MNVLSLFDGISCGQIALNRAGIQYNNYYASEIEKSAIKVTQHNYPNTVQLGSVLDVTSDKLPKIDLLIAGSPCQGFSFAGKQLNFDDPRSKLFFEFVRLLKEIKPKWFLLENVVMKQEYQDVISELLGVKPVKINSALVSAQNRNRLYWTNIPFEMPEDKGILLETIIEDELSFAGAVRGRYAATVVGRKLDENLTRKDYSDITIKQYIEIRSKTKTNCLTTVGKDTVLADENYPKGTLAVDAKWRYLTRTECERLQTVPEGYTSPISDSAAKRALGNGWTVEVVTHILKSLIP